MIPIFRFRVISALVKKEVIQIIRDPSSIMIAFILPVILLLIFGYGLSLDLKNVKIALVLEDTKPLALSFANTLNATDYINSIPFPSRAAAKTEISKGKLRGIVIVPNDFSWKIQNQQTGEIELITDGSDVYTAQLLEFYVFEIFQVWEKHQEDFRQFTLMPKISLISRIWFNPGLNSRNVLIPGVIVMIIAIIGVLLTALVVAREWERGTMETILTVPIHRSEMVFGKLFPYYFLGIMSMVICVVSGKFLFGTPFRGTFFPLFLATSIFLLAALAEGFFISTITKNQLLASMAALILSFLPNYFLSGILFEIDSMPKPIQIISYIFPARYFTDSLQTLFIVGNVWELLLKNFLGMAVIGLVFLTAAVYVMPKRLE